MQKIEKMLEHIVSMIVEDETKVKITSKTDDMGVLMTLEVAKEDMAKIIGKDGSTARALRTVLRCVGMAQGARVSLKINEPQN